MGTQMSKETLEAMWADFGDTPVNELNEIDEPFCGFDRLTDRDEVWHWFDEQYATWGGVYALMFPGEHGAASSNYGSEC